MMNQARLYISILLDNSPSMEEKKLNELIDGFNQLFVTFDQYQEEERLQVQIVAFHDFEPVVCKSRSERTLSQTVTPNAFPLMGRALEMIGKDLAQALAKEEEPVHTPWLVVISNGMTLDSIASSHSALKALKSKYNLRYLPFLTTREKVSSRQVETDQFEAKKPMVILDKKLDLFFRWLSEDIKNRIETPLDERVNSDKKLLEGWTIL
jgi:uncharacterized protein YegL